MFFYYYTWIIWQRRIERDVRILRDFKEVQGNSYFPMSFATSCRFAESLAYKPIVAAVGSDKRDLSDKI
jgi:hypothetical protein